MLVDKSVKFPLKYKAIDVCENKSLLAIFFYETFFVSMYVDFSKKIFSDKIASYHMNRFSDKVIKVTVASKNSVILQAKSVEHEFSEFISKISVSSIN